MTHLESTQVKRTKKRVLQAIAMGLLTFAVTPIVTLLITVPLLIFGKISEAFNPIIIVSRIFDFRELGGFFASQLFFVGVLTLIGDFATAILSWRKFYSKKLAAITFLSAISFQFIAVGIILPLTIQQSRRIIEAGIAHESAYGQYATIGKIGSEVYGKYSDQEITNLHPEFGPLYKKLEILVPISVSQAGSYQVAVEYWFSKEGAHGNTRVKEITRHFDAQEHIVIIEFDANESGGNYGYWSPKSVDGKTRVQLNYITSKSGATKRGQAVTKFVGAVSN